MRKTTLLLTVLATLTLASCHKTCTCLAYNGTEHTYTADEVAEQRGSCTDMEYMYTHETSGAIVRYYTVCEWD